MSTSIRELDDKLNHSDFLKKLMKNTTTVRKGSNTIPDPSQIQYLKNLPKYKDALNNFNKQTTKVFAKIFQFLQVPYRFPPPQILLNFKPIEDATDKMLEEVDLAIDKMKKKDLNDQGMIIQPMISGENTYDALYKPQLNFYTAPDNSDLPFIPLLKQKENALVELDQSIKEAQENPTAFFFGKDIANFTFDHPYFTEIYSLKSENCVILDEILQPKKISETPLIYVDTEEKFEIFYNDICQQKLICIDLENHSEHSYQGFNCLMQISTLDNDYIIDTLVPEIRSKVSTLLKPFSDPNILKILHGSDMDIVWMQRDFGVYIVNMFDTGQAARILKLPSYSLAYLLQKYCNRVVNKNFQLADWRMRPLTSELILYAREDTHYLSFIYSQLIIELKNKAKADNIANEFYYIDECFQNSLKISLKIYSKPRAKDNHYQQILSRNQYVLSEKKFEALKNFWVLRDAIARKEDENPHVICSNSSMFKIIEIFPRSMIQIAQMRDLPAFVRKYGEDFVNLFVNIEENVSRLIPQTSSDSKNKQIIENDHVDHIIESYQDEVNYIQEEMPKLELVPVESKIQKTTGNEMSPFEKPIKSQIKVESYNRVVDLLTDLQPKFAETYWAALEEMKKLCIEEKNLSEGKKIQKEVVAPIQENEDIEFIRVKKVKGLQSHKKEEKIIDLGIKRTPASLLDTSELESTLNAKKVNLSSSQGNKEISKASYEKKKNPIYNPFETLKIKEDGTVPPEILPEKSYKHKLNMNFSKKIEDIGDDNGIGNFGRKKDKRFQNKKPSRFGKKLNNKMYFQQS